MILHLCPFELEIKMADEDEIFQKFCRKNPEWMADFEKPCLSLELEIFKSTRNDGEPAPVVETPSMSEISNQDGNCIAEREDYSDSQEFEDFILAQKSSNTVKKTKSDMRALKWFFAVKCTPAKPSELGPFYPVHFPHNVTWNL